MINVWREKMNYSLRIHNALQAVLYYGHICNFSEEESFSEQWSFFPHQEEMKYNYGLNNCNLPICEHTKYHHCESPMFWSHNFCLEQNPRTHTVSSTCFVKNRERLNDLPRVTCRVSGLSYISLSFHLGNFMELFIKKNINMKELNGFQATTFKYLREKVYDVYGSSSERYDQEPLRIIF